MAKKCKRCGKELKQSNHFKIIDVFESHGIEFKRISLICTECYIKYEKFMNMEEKLK